MGLNVEVVHESLRALKIWPVDYSFVDLVQVSADIIEENDEGAQVIDSRLLREVRRARQYGLLPSY